MKKATLNLKDITVKDLNGQEYDLEFSKDIGNAVFMNAQTIEVSDLARGIHSGKPVEVDAEELEQIRAIVAARPVYLPFIQREIDNYLTKLRIQAD